MGIGLNTAQRLTSKAGVLPSYGQTHDSQLSKKHGKASHGGKHSRRDKARSKPDSDSAQMLGLSDREPKVSVINVLRALMEKGDNIQEQVCN